MKTPGAVIQLVLCTLLLASGTRDVRQAGVPTTPQYHIPFNVGKGGCCADINALGEYKGMAHLFKQNGGVPGGHGEGFAHYVSKDFVNWVNLPTIVQPGGADGSLNFLPDGPVILWDCTSVQDCRPEAPKPPVPPYHGPTLEMHHVTSCSQCGKAKGPPGSWCWDPHCVPFDFDDKHKKGPDLAHIGCAALGPDPSNATVYCEGGGGTIYAATVATPQGGGSAIDAETPSTPVTELGGTGVSSSRCHSGDAAIIGVARPIDPSDANLTHWVKDKKNPIVVGPVGTDCYAGPSNLWRTADGKTYMVMIYDTKTGLFSSDDPSLHNWTLANGDFYPRRGGGGGLFFPLPGQPKGHFTHMLQSDFPGQADGTAYYALGRYNPSNGTFDHTAAEPRALDFSNTYVYNELGYRSDGTMVNAGWIRGLGTSVVREVTYDEELQTLLSFPVPELEKLRSAKPLACGVAPLPTNGSGYTLLRADEGGSVVDIDMAFALPPHTPVQFGVDLLGIEGALKLEVAAPNADSSRNVTLVVEACRGTFVLPKPAVSLPVRVLVDVVSLEVFAGRGRGVCSVSVPGSQIGKPAPVAVRGTSSPPGGTLPLTVTGVWAMRSIPAA